MAKSVQLSILLFPCKSDVQQHKQLAAQLQLCQAVCHTAIVKEKKSKAKTTPFGVNLMSSQVLYQTAQVVLVTSFCGWMQEQAGNSFLQRSRLFQARFCADGECGGHLQEGGRHLCQVSHGLPPGYALPSQSWHHRSLWIWCSSDTQQVSSALLCCSLSCTTDM